MSIVLNYNPTQYNEVRHLRLYTGILYFKNKTGSGMNENS